MLDRARERGEQPPDVLDVRDHTLAPMYVRVLFAAGPLTPDYIDTLVDRLRLSPNAGPEARQDASGLAAHANSVPGRTEP